MGEVNLDLTTDVSDGASKSFSIDIYPVTNSQFIKFIKAGGYSDDKLWTDKLGREWKDANDIILPKYWCDDKFRQPLQPVVGVSHYEATAYANWLGKRLPTEDEWMWTRPVTLGPVESTLRPIP